MVELHSSNFRVITTNFLGVQIFRKFTINQDGTRRRFYLTATPLAHLNGSLNSFILTGYFLSPDILPGEMGGRSGPIQAAINLEIPEGNIKYFNVKMEGLNGQLPNLDLVNLVVRLCKKHNIGVGLHHRVSGVMSDFIIG